MEDGGVLKEGFLVKRVSAGASRDRTLPRAAGGRAPAHRSGVPSSAPGRTGRLGLCGAELCPRGEPADSLLRKKAGAQARPVPISVDGVRVVATEAAVVITATY